MAGENEKQLRKALRAEVNPLLIGLRSDNKQLWKAIKLLIEEQKKTRNVNIKRQEFPEIQKVETTNPQREIKVSNFPETTKVVGIKGLFGNLYNKLEQLENKRDEGLQRLFLGFTKAIKVHIFKVRVENPTEIKFPKVQTVDFVKGIKELLKQEAVQRVKIENSTPKDAIPVVLVDKDKKRFYNILSAISSGINHATDVRSLFQKFFDEGRTFKVTSDIISTANNQNENELILIRNPAGSDTKIRFDDMKFQSSGNILTFVRIYRVPTVTDTGVPLVVNNTRTDGKPPKSLAFFAPTASDFGTLLETFISTIENNFDIENKLVDTLLEGEDLLITVQQSSSSSQNSSFDTHYIEQHN